MSIAFLSACGTAGTTAQPVAAPDRTQQPAPPTPAEPAAVGSTSAVQTITAPAVPAGLDGRPIDRTNASTPGSLKNPYANATEEIIAQGRERYLAYGCNGCHGGGGGGGMGPPLSNEVWVYGSDDDTLFRLTAIGSVELQKLGYARKSREGVVAPMLPYGQLIKTEDELWKMIAFIRTTYRGDPSRKNW
ncbi:MAG: c-type cytochrome [Candidatus Methylomirabilis oxygeniifera]|nr:MAG: c-type cytochrome [Candidatus Methylomirabilis oxyfera]